MLQYVIPSTEILISSLQFALNPSLHRPSLFPRLLVSTISTYISSTIPLVLTSFLSPDLCIRVYISLLPLYTHSFVFSHVYSSVQFSSIPLFHVRLIRYLSCFAYCRSDHYHCTLIFIIFILHTFLQPDKHRPLLTHIFLIYLLDL